MKRQLPWYKRIFELYDRGIGSKAIAVTLNREGYRTNQGLMFGVKLSSGF